MKDSGKFDRCYKGNIHGDLQHEYQCTQCSKRFAEHSHYNSHMCDHLPCQCPYCPKAFKTQKYLNQHLKMHKPNSFVCTYCGESFRWKYRMKHHVKNNHEQMSVQGPST